MIYDIDREKADAIFCVENGLCSTGMPLPCGHDVDYARWELAREENRGGVVGTILIRLKRNHGRPL